MKITALLLLTAFAVSASTLTGCAAEQTESTDTNPIEIVLKIGSPIMNVNGEEKNIDEEGTVPVIKDGRTLLPARAVVEEMGGSAAWNADTQTVNLVDNDSEIRLVIGNKTAYLNDTAEALDAAPEIINGRTMLPIRFIAESFGFKAEWNAAEQSITITNNNKPIHGSDFKIAEDNLILIQGGTFQMGSPKNEAERDADEIQHTVTVDSFYMADSEITQKDYQTVMGANPSETKGDKLPVTNITWYDAIEYCNKLSESKGLTPCYTVTGNTVVWDKAADGYRLPTEAEWEYAARANTDTPFNFGDYVYDENANCYNAYGYNNDASGSRVNGYIGHTVDVKGYDPNAFGLYDMHGNAAEWMWDWYGEYDTNTAKNPTGTETGKYKIARGGGWNDFPKHIRSAYRSAFPGDVPLYGIGMRVVRNAAPGVGQVQSVYKENTESKSGKTLIVYFSQTGNTDGLAKIIQEMSGADIFRLERKTPYSAAGNFQTLYAEALNEYRESAVPELKTYLEDEGIDISEYDTILLGYCNWWASIPAPVRSFLKHYDLSGKTIIPFCSMGGGRFGQTISTVAKLAPNSTIKEGLDVTYSSYDRDRIGKWFEKNNVSH